jgi:hypothetical protein
MADGADKHDSGELRHGIVPAQALLHGLERVIRLMLLYPQGLSILLGHVPPPSSLVLLSAFPPKAFDSMGIHSSRRPYEERVTEMSAWIDDVIRQSGGWGHICHCVRLWQHEHPGTWNMVAEHIRNVRPRSGRSEERALRQIADKYCVSVKTVTRRRRQFAGLLAASVLATPASMAVDWP